MSARNMAKRTAAGTLALAVCLGGGAIALASAASADANFKFDRIAAGTDRFDTAIQSSKTAFPSAGQAGGVVLVNGWRSVDGLTASSLAGAYQASILYSETDAVPQSTRDEINRLGTKNIWLVGGTTVLSSKLEADLKSAGFTVNRVGGSDRFETAAKVSDQVIAKQGKKPGHVFVTSGVDGNLSDSTVLAPLAYSTGSPILLSEPGDAPKYTTDQLDDVKGAEIHVVGGKSALTDAVYNEVGAKDRIAGADRGETANYVSDFAKKVFGFSTANAALVGAKNSNVADSLAAAAFLGNAKTTIHYAGLDSTNQYFKDHSAELSGKGWIIGGKDVVTDDQVAAATKAVQSVAAAAGFIVTAATNTSFSYGDPVSMQAKKVTLKSTDKYTVSGASATQAAFVDNLKVGATVTVSISGDVATYGLTPVTSTTYSSGMVGVVDTASGANHHYFSVVEPITGQPLPFLSATATNYDYTTNAPYVTYSVDGQTVNQTLFENALSIGDSVSVTGTGADLQHLRTVALTSGSLVGTVSAVNTSSGLIAAGGSAAATGLRVKSSAGAVFDVPVPVSGDSVTIDGTASTYSTFIGTGNTASTQSPVSVGDQITFSKVGGVQKFTLVNAAPSKLAGVVADTVTIAGSAQATSSSQLAYWSPAGTPTKVAYTDVARFVIDGVIGSKTDFVAAATPGDSVVYQPADATTNSVATLTLTSKPLAGAVVIGDASVTNHTLSVLDADGDQIATAVDYASPTSVYSTGTGSVLFSLDGATVTRAQFDAAVGRIVSGARQGSVQVSVNSGTVTWALSTTAFTAAPAMVSVTKVDSTHIAVTFNKPVNNSGPAAADWTVTGITSTAAPQLSANNTVLTFTATATIAANTAISVAPASAAKAALYTDTYGTAISTSSISFTS